MTDEEDMQEDSPEDGAQVFRRILVGLDGSEGSQRALAWATRAAAMAGAEVLAVHVLTPSREMRVDLSPTGLTNWRIALRKDLETTWTAPLRDAGVTHRAILVEDDTPAAGICQLADGEHVDLVVVGAQGHRGFADRLLGSVSQRLAHHAHQPVVIVPPDWWTPPPAA